jgi:iron complex transport system permease protein
LLNGIVFAALFNGLASFMQVMIDPNEFSILQGKMFATFSNINDELLVYSILILVFVFLYILKDFYKLDVLSLGREASINLGVNHKKTVFKNLIVISILTSVVTALVGPISFLGIIIASLSRHIFKTYRHSIRMIGGTLITMIFLTLAVFIVEHIFNFSVTVSVIINLVGGIYFIMLLIKEARP